MSENVTNNLDGGRTFEERVLGRFDAMDARFDAVDVRFDGVDSAIRNLDSRVQVLELRAYDTKPIWEQALKEIVDTRRELTKRLDRIEAVVYETRSNLRDVEDRVEKLESKPV